MNKTYMADNAANTLMKGNHLVAKEAVQNTQTKILDKASSFKTVQYKWKLTVHYKKSKTTFKAECGLE